MSQVARRCRRSARSSPSSRSGAYIQFTVVAPGVAAGFAPGHFVAVAVGGDESALVLRRAFALYGAATRRVRRHRPVRGGGARRGHPLAGAASGRAPGWISSARSGTPFPLPHDPAAGRAGRRRLRHGAADPARRTADSTWAAEWRWSSAQPPRTGCSDELAGQAPRRRGHRDHRRRLRRPSRGGSPTRCPAAIERIGARASTPAGRWRCCTRSARWPGARHSRAGGGRGGDGLRDRGVHDLRAAGAGRRRTQSRFVRSCVEGPVFEADRVRWADVGQLPEDLVGADAMEGTLSSWSTCAPGWPSVTLPNPVLTASGCAAAGRELDQFFDVSALGAVVTKSIMLRPRSGRPTPRMAETPSGMLNSIGLQGPGIDSFIAHDLAWLAEHGARAVVSIAGGHTDEYVALAERLADHPAVSMIEVNISCPNVESRGQVFACDPVASARVIGAVRRAAADRIPILAKLSPDVTDITADRPRVRRRRRRRVVADQHAARHGRSTPTPWRPRSAAITGGLSGPGDPSGRRALRLAGPPGAPAPADPRDGRHHDRAGRAAVHPGRRVRGVGRDGGVRRSGRADAGAGRAGARAGRPRVRRPSPTRSGIAHLAEDERAGRIPADGMNRAAGRRRGRSSR